MQFSDKGKALLKELEGFRSNRYYDSAGVLTIGYGTVWHPDIPLEVNQEEAEKLLMRYVAPVENALNSMVHVPLTQNQFDALVIFTYNVGIAAFANSTLLKKVNEQDFVGASGEFLRWVHAGHRVVPGLYSRRNAEKALFNEV